MYEPNDSPFGEAFTAFIDGQFIGAEYSAATLDEFEQIARTKLTIPAYAFDSRLREFAAELWVAQQRGRVVL
jgi:hypothetical protein